jgi:hypothetical protein
MIIISHEKSLRAVMTSRESLLLHMAFISHWAQSAFCFVSSRLASSRLVSSRIVYFLTLRPVSYDSPDCGVLPVNTRA